MKHTEECPYCEIEVGLKYKFKLQKCPICKNLIAPCLLCEHTNKYGCHTECDTCPLGVKEFSIV